MSAELTPTRRTFYDIADDLAAYQETLEMLESESSDSIFSESELAIGKADVKARIAAICKELEGKAEAIAAVVTRQKSEIALLKAEEQRIQARRIAAEKSAEHLKNYVIGVMQANGQTMLRTPKATIRIQGNGGIEPLEIKAMPEELNLCRMEGWVRADLWELAIDLVRTNSARGTKINDYSMKKVPDGEAIRDALRSDDVLGSRLLERGVHLRVS